MISCKFEILVWSNSSLPVDSTDAASLEVKKIKNKQGNWKIYKFGSIYAAWKASKYGVFPVRIFLYLDRIQENTDQKNSIWTLSPQCWTLQFIIFHLKRIFWTFSLPLIILEFKSVIDINLCKKYLICLFSLLSNQSFKDINIKEDGGNLLKTLETFSEKLSIFTVWYAHACTRQGVRIASFSGRFACELSKSPKRKSNDCKRHYHQNHTI